MLAKSRRKESAFGAENWKIYVDTGFDVDRVWKKR
jgi:hypothetical protein